MSLLSIFRKKEKVIKIKLNKTVAFLDFELKDGDYILSGNHPDALKYKILFNGKDVTHTIRALIKNRFMI